MIDVRRRLFVLPALIPVLPSCKMDGPKDEQVTVTCLFHEVTGWFLTQVQSL